MTTKPIFVYINQNGFIAKNTFGEYTLVPTWAAAHPFNSVDALRFATGEVFGGLIAAVGCVALHECTDIDLS